MIYSQIDATGWVIIIGAVFLGIDKLVTMYLNYRREQDQKNRDAIIAQTLAASGQKVERAVEKVEEVKQRTDATAEKRDGQMTTVLSKMEEISTKADGLTRQLLRKTEDEAKLRGKVEQKEVTDALLEAERSKHKGDTE